MRSDIYQRITDQIISELEKGVRLWLKPVERRHTSRGPCRAALAP